MGKDDTCVPEPHMPDCSVEISSRQVVGENTSHGRSLSFSHRLPYMLVPLCNPDCGYLGCRKACEVLDIASSHLTIFGRKSKHCLLPRHAMGSRCGIRCMLAEIGQLVCTSRGDLGSQVMPGVISNTDSRANKTQTPPLLAWRVLCQPLALAIAPRRSKDPLPIPCTFVIILDRPPVLRRPWQSSR